LNDFIKYAANLKPHPSKVTIFIETDEGDGGIEEINKVLNQAGFIPFETEVIAEQSPNWILVFLSSDNMREATLKLFEAGFVNIVGINPKPPAKDST